MSKRLARPHPLDLAEEVVDEHGRIRDGSAARVDLGAVAGREDHRLGGAAAEAERFHGARHFLVVQDDRVAHLDGRRVIGESYTEEIERSRGELGHRDHLNVWNEFTKRSVTTRERRRVVKPARDA